MKNDDPAPDCAGSTVNGSGPELLTGRTLLVTAPRASAPRLASPLRALGANVIELPMIHFAEPEQPDTLQRAASPANDVDWIALLSPRAAQAWVSVATGQVTARIAVVGSATRRAVEAAGHEVDVEAPEATAGSLADELLKRGKPAQMRVLLLQGEQGRPDFAAQMHAVGAQVTTVHAYRTLPPSADDYAKYEARVAGLQSNAIAFTSPSTFEHFHTSPALRAQLDHATLFAIGPTTSEAIGARSRLCHTATPHTYDGLVRAICEHLKAE